jgi:hypothetical protein
MSAADRYLALLRQDAVRLDKQLRHATSRDEALDIAIKAADTSLKALEFVRDPVEKARCRTRAERYMREAERIKNNTEWHASDDLASLSLHADDDASLRLPETPSTQVRLLKEPVNSRQISTKEKIIVIKAGFLNGVKFPEWNGEPSSQDFELADGEDLFLYVSL